MGDNREPEGAGQLKKWTCERKSFYYTLHEHGVYFLCKEMYHVPGI